MAPPHLLGPHRPWLFDPLQMGAELLYAALVIAICLFIFFKTKELYKLSGHKGIQFFRRTFFFFALAFFFRLVPVLFRLADFHPLDLRFYGFQLGFFLFAYASTMAILSLGRSVMWKRLKSSFFAKAYVYHFFSLLIASTVYLGNDRLLFFIVEAVLILVVFLLTYLFHPKKKSRKNSSYLTYLLLLLFWMLNLAIITIPKFMSIAIYVLYILSFAVFFFIFKKVLGRTKRS